MVGGPGFEPGASRSRITRQFIQTCRSLRFSVQFFKSTRPERPDWYESSAGLLHEVLQDAGGPDGLSPRIKYQSRPAWGHSPLTAHTYHDRSGCETAATTAI